MLKTKRLGPSLQRLPGGRAGATQPSSHPGGSGWRAEQQRGNRNHRNHPGWRGREEGEGPGLCRGQQPLSPGRLLARLAAKEPGPARAEREPRAKPGPATRPPPPPSRHKAGPASLLRQVPLPGSRAPEESRGRRGSYPESCRPPRSWRQAPSSLTGGSPSEHKGTALRNSGEPRRGPAGPKESARRPEVAGGGGFSPADGGFGRPAKQSGRLCFEEGGRKGPR